MRVLLCQTPRLTYVQAIELLQRETLNGPADMALFPEMAIEHPPQCTGQGNLTLENVALLMLSRFCKQRKMYIVLGSVEERTENGLYDTTIVLNREGEMLPFYRKQSAVLLGKATGNQPGFFDSEYGPIGILLGAEIEEEQRWQDLLARRPYLILNPARAPMQLDPVLISTHPELQVTAWFKGLRRLEHIVETRTRGCACSFVRADAPFQDGGAGTSLMVEPHRSVLAPRWGVAFLMVDTLSPYELEARKLPGWRQLTVDERARLATRDRALLTQEEIERGPRYLVWTLRSGDKGGLRTPGRAHWNNSAAQRDNITSGFDAAMSENMVTMRRPASFLVRLATKDNRPLYASITKKGELLIWDVKLKREFSSSHLGASGLTAVNNWRNANQIIVSSSAKGIVTIKVFEEHTPICEVKLDHELEVRKHRKSSLHTRRRTPDVRDRVDRQAWMNTLEVAATKRAPVARHLFHVGDSLAVVVFEPMDADSGPTGKIIDMEEGSVNDLDVYGSGPPLVVESESGSEDSEEEYKAPKVDKLVHARIVDYHAKGRRHTVLVCLYDSNRLVQVTLGDGRLYELMLLEETATDRQRSDQPICFNVLANWSADTYHIVASYQSMTVRWWHVTLSSCKLQSHTTLTYPVTHLTLFEWSSSGAADLPGEIASSRPRRTARASVSPRKTSPSQGFEQGVRNAKRSTIKSIKILDSMATTGGSNVSSPSHGQGRVSLAPLTGLGQLVATGGLGGTGELNNTGGKVKPRASIKVDGMRSVVGSMRFGGRQSVSAGGPSPVAAHDDFLPKDHACICAVAFDVVGGMPFLFARGGRIAKVYTCSDHFVDRSAKVDQLLCDGSTIAVQLSNGDIRHVEFVFEEDVIALRDVPLELPT